MSNYNKVLLLGRLTRDPELRYTPQGTPVVDIGVAVNREYTTGTERRKETTFVDVTLWKRQAEVVSQYLKKGAPIFIEGRLSLDSWEQDGQKRSRLRVVAENFQFVGGRAEGEAGGDDAGYRARSRPAQDALESGAPSASPRYGHSPAGQGAAEGGEGEGPDSSAALPLGLDESEIPF
jgi:single-strand DNA-binding protein